jgi:hypothetical protein
MMLRKQVPRGKNCPKHTLSADGRVSKTYLGQSLAPQSISGRKQIDYRDRVSHPQLVGLQALTYSEQEGQYHNGRVLLGWLYIYRDLGIEVDVETDKGEKILDSDYGDYQW